MLSVSKTQQLAISFQELPHKLLIWAGYAKQMWLCLLGFLLNLIKLKSVSFIRPYCSVYLYSSPILLLIHRPHLFVPKSQWPDWTDVIPSHTSSVWVFYFITVFKSCTKVWCCAIWIGNLQYGSRRDASHKPGWNTCAYISVACAYIHVWQLGLRLVWKAARKLLLLTLVSFLHWLLSQTGICLLNWL